MLIVSVVARGCSLTSPSPRLSRPEAVEVALEQAGLGLYDEVAVDRSNGDVVSVAIR